MVELLQVVAGSADVAALVHDRLRTVAEPDRPFAGNVAAILDEVVGLATHDRWRSALLHLDRGPFGTLVDIAIDAGEIDSDDRDIVIDTLIATIAGMTSMASVAPAVQAEVLQGFKWLFGCAFTAKGR